MNNNREIINLDDNWKFKKGMDVAGFDPRIDDSSWESINIPHDWSIFGPFKEDNPSGPRGGYAPGGIAWYRQSLNLPESYSNKKIFIELDGVYMNSEIHINGERVAKYPYGYTTLYYDITSFVNCGKDNLISVKVDTSVQPSSRWYSGSGIYRHVRLIVTDKLHIGQWGTFITTPEVSSKQSSINIETTLVNNTFENRDAEIRSSIIDTEGNCITTVSQNVTMDGISSDFREQTEDEKTHFGIEDTIVPVTEVFSSTVNIDNPTLWSLENPYLYSVKTEILVNSEVIDNDSVNLGIRSIEFDANSGFKLNGVVTKIKGVCLHHDGGALGAACPDRAKERQIQILQEMGCNAIRTSHNPPTPALLDLCDKYGMLVMDEVFDEYRSGKRPRVFDETGSLSKQVRRPIYAYAEFFDDYHRADITTMVKRDRNHPSIILWSIGNEISEHMTQEGVELTTRLHNIVKEHDISRPTITGLVHLEGANKLGIPDIVDVSGYNYKEPLYEAEHKLYPDRKIIGSETSSAAPFEKRGVYDNFLKSNPNLDCFDDVVQELGDLASTDSDERYIRAEYSWKVTNELDFISGLFIWTGFDYIGEPSPYAWPSKTSYFGVIDTCGFPKDAFYMYQSQWSEKPMLHLFPHWNHEGKEGQDIPVWCFTNLDSVELLLNGESLGCKVLKDEPFLHLDWRVPYKKGTLKAIGKKDGEVVLEEVITTTEAPQSILLEADRAIIDADNQDLSYITVKVIDQDKNIVPTANNQISFNVEGCGALVGLDNGDPESLEEYKGSVRSVLGGICLAIVQSSKTPGDIVITAESEGLVSAKLVIKSK